ncbi:MAG: DUF1614 domain-containing protein [Rubrobacteridae bacterium]|nr:DUF1614 domain-containing protein [Rubrobacteridae bacterium]
MPAILIPILLVFIVTIFFALVFINVIAISFVKLGLTPSQTFFIFLAIIIGGYINVPVSHRRVRVLDERRMPYPFFYYPPRFAEQTIFVNVGGAIIPVLLSLCFLPQAPAIPTLIATGVIIIISKLLARVVPGVGIAMPAFIPPVISAILALLLAPNNAAPVAYISGVLGTLIGADLLNLRKIREIGALSISIGGAGVFDGVFLVGIIAALLT